MPDHHHVRTERLQLDALCEADTDQVYALNCDAALWEHFPSGRHTSPEQTAAQLEKFRAAWKRDGLGYWAARDLQGDRLLGVGGCMLRDELAWNLYYRFAPIAQGHGYAAELIRAARAAAIQTRSDVPIVAYLLEHNVASRRVAERAGLDLVWRGPDAGNADPDAVRLVFADRTMEPAALADLVAH